MCIFNIFCVDIPYLSLIPAIYYTQYKHKYDMWTASEIYHPSHVALG